MLLTLMNGKLVFTLLASSLLLCGCDFFRGLAGRPTSADIAEKRAVLELRAKEKEKARADSLRIAELAEEAEKDSLAALERLSEISAKLMGVKAVGGVADGLGTHYCLIVGSFRSAANAERMAETARAAGYSPGILHMRNGLFTVSAVSCDRLCDAVAALEKVRTEKFCPADAWILYDEPAPDNNPVLK